MSHIRYLIAKAIADHLETKLITDVSESDPLRASIVKFGRFQQSPIENYLYVSVIGGNVQDPTVQDGIVTIDDMEDIGLRIPAREIGGGEMWFRRGWVEIGAYFIAQGLAEELAADYAHTFMGRVSSNIKTAPVGGITDEFGEIASCIYVYAESLFEGGGPPNQYLWRGQIQWQVLTERS